MRPEAKIHRVIDDELCWPLWPQQTWAWVRQNMATQSTTVTSTLRSLAEAKGPEHPKSRDSTWRRSDSPKRTLSTAIKISKSQGR